MSEMCNQRIGRMWISTISIRVQEGERIALDLAHGLSSASGHTGPALYGSENSSANWETLDLPIASTRSSKVFVFVSRICLSRVSTVPRQAKLHTQTVFVCPILKTLSLA